MIKERFPRDIHRMGVPQAKLARQQLFYLCGYLIPLQEGLRGVSRPIR